LPNAAEALAVENAGLFLRSSGFSPLAPESETRRTDREEPKRTFVRHLYHGRVRLARFDRFAGVGIGVVEKLSATVFCGDAAKDPPLPLFPSR
jgi:hypothetical protein